MIHLVYGALILLSFFAGALITWIRMENSYLFEEIPEDETSPLDKTRDREKTSLVMDPQLTLRNICSNKDLLISIGLFLDTSSIACLSITSLMFERLLQLDIFWKYYWKSKYSSLFFSNSIKLQEMISQRGIELDTQWSPVMGWRNFFALFEFSWINYLLAGMNTHDQCYIGIHHAIYDITDFIHIHPGSEETLLWASGCDASVIFQDIGHSSMALEIMKSLKLWGPSSSESNTNNKYHPNGAYVLNLKRQMVRAICKAGSDYRDGVAADAQFHVSHVLSLAPMTSFRRAQGPCANLHNGQCKVFLNPFTEEWTVWWTCCGWGMPLDMSSDTRHSYSLNSISSYSSNLPAIVNKTYHLIDDIHRTMF